MNERLKKLCRQVEIIEKEMESWSQWKKDYCAELQAARRSQRTPQARYERAMMEYEDSLSSYHYSYWQGDKLPHKPQPEDFGIKDE